MFHFCSTLIANINMLKRSYRSYLMFNNWFRWGCWMHPDGSAGLNNNASPKWECVLAAVLQHSRVWVCWGEMMPGDLTLWAMQRYGRWVISRFCGLLTGTEKCSDHLPLQPPSSCTAAVSSPQCPSPQHISPLLFPFSSVDSLHSSSFFLIHLCEIWWDSNL